MRADALLVTNTSTLPVIDLAVVTGRPERVCGVHFFNPAPVMSLVEIVRPLTADDATIELAKAFALDCGKEPVIVEDRAGFIVNALLFPYLNNAVRMYEQGTATMQDIDTAMKGGCGFPMGPFSLLDLVGPGHVGRHPRRAVRGVPRPELRAGALAAPDGDRRPARPQVRPRLLHVRPLTDWAAASSKGGGPDAPGDTVRARARAPAIEPIEPPPTRWRLPAPGSSAVDDLIGVGADLEPGTVLAAYRRGLFPMPVSRRRLGWWSPDPRGILPLDGAAGDALAAPLAAAVRAAGRHLLPRPS